jgi:hypothetical protein
MNRDGAYTIEPRRQWVYMHRNLATTLSEKEAKSGENEISERHNVDSRMGIQRDHLHLSACRALCGAL